MVVKRFFDIDTFSVNNRKLNFCMYKRENGEGKKDINLSIMRTSRLYDCPGYENEWGIDRIKTVTLWRNYKGSPKKVK